MNSFTIDASVVLKWVTYENELNLESAEQIFKNGLLKKLTLVAPTLLKAEVSNILLKKKKLTVSRIKNALKLISKTNMIFAELNNSLINKAIILAKKYDLSVYDGIYLATSELSRAPLITDDEKGLGKINKVILLKNYNRVKLQV